MMEIRKQTARDDLRARALTKLEPAIPIVMNKLLGRPLLAEDKHKPIDELVLSMSDEQVDKMMQVLTPQQQLAIYAIWKEAKERHENEAKKMKEATAPATSSPATTPATPATPPTTNGNGAS